MARLQVGLLRIQMHWHIIFKVQSLMSPLVFTTSTKPLFYRKLVFNSTGVILTKTRLDLGTDSPWA